MGKAGRSLASMRRVLYILSRAIAKRFLCVRVCQGPQGDACTAGSLSATSLVAGAKFAILDGIRRVQSEFPMIRPHNTFLKGYNGRSGSSSDIFL